MSNSRRVYSTDDGDLRKEPDASARQPLDPGDGVVRVAREKSGRKGKTVTIVRGVGAGSPLDWFPLPSGVGPGFGTRA